MKLQPCKPLSFVSASEKLSVVSIQIFYELYNKGKSFKVIYTKMALTRSLVSKPYSDFLIISKRRHYSLRKTLIL